METAVELDGVAKSFKGLEVFRDVDLKIPRGALCGIQGVNGSGKSVLFKIMCKLIKPDAGKVQLTPGLMDDGDYYPTNVGVVIDHPGYLPGLTGVENLRELASIRKKVGEDAINEALERVGLSPAIKQTVRKYSLGMKQKLALAQAFMEGQQLLLLDEAFNGLDVSSVDRVRALLLDLKAEGRTIVITSHQQEDIDALCDHVWRINEGTLEEIR